MAQATATKAGSNGTGSALSNREQALALARAQIRKSFGDGAIMTLDSKTIVPCPVIPTGSLELDVALGVGGIPRARVSEIYGAEGGGKTTLALHVIAKAQKADGWAGFVDAEHALDAGYAQALGVRLDRIDFSQPSSGEEALEIVSMMVDSAAYDVIVVDSVAALVPRAELEGEMGDSLPGLQARLMSQALRKLTGTISKSKTAVIFINQLREKIGVSWGNPETTTGGRALKFYSSVRLDVHRIGAVKDGEEVIGNRIKVKVVKNKCAPPFRTAEFDLIFGKGICRLGSLVDLAATHNLMEKSGAWYSMNGERIGQGRESAKRFLTDNPQMADDLEAKLRIALGLTPAALAEVEAAA